MAVAATGSPATTAAEVATTTAAVWSAAALVAVADVGRSDADDVAAAAARAGAQSVDLGDVRAGTSTGANPTRARSAARAYLTAAGMTGTTTLTDSGRTLSVTATAAYTPVFLGAIGVEEMTVTGTATVDLVQVQQGELR